MGNCLSTPGVSHGSHHQQGADILAGGPGGGQQHYKGGAKHDSVHSLDTAAPRDGKGAAGSLKQQKQKQTGSSSKAKHMQQLDPQASSAGSLGTSAASGPAKPRKPPGIDLATGKNIPDFNVNGVLDVLHELGSGGSGTTYLCRDLATSKLLAVKFVPRPLPKAAVPLMMAEVELQAQLGEGHVNIITMRELLLTRTHLALVMDYASGGALTHRVSDLWESALTRGGLHMDEQEACYYLRQFVSAMDYLHRHKVAHRDLKLDNTLLEDRLGPAYVRICDFGFAKSWTATATDNMKTAIGTPVYMSPQMIAAKQCSSGYSGVKADMWAAGVLLFVMLLGAFPFDHAENLDPNSRQASTEVWLRQQAPGGWRKHPLAVEALSRQVLSPDCCELLDGLLEMDEEKRFSTQDVLSHPWMQQTLLPDQQRAWEELQQQQQEITQNIALKSDAYKVRLRKQALHAMLAFAGKPPGRTSLLPQPSSALSPQQSMAGSNTSAAAAAAAAVAALDAERSETSPAASAAAVSTSAAAGAAPTSTPPALAEASAPAGVTDVDAFRVDSTGDASVASADRTQHMSFQAGEGLRSDSLEAKVEAYRQQLADVRAARMAATAAHQQQQQAASQASSVSSSTTGPAAAGQASPFAAATASAAAAGVGGSAGSSGKVLLSPPLSPTESAASPEPSSPAVSSSKKPARTTSKAVSAGSNTSTATTAAAATTATTSTASSGSKRGLKGLFSGAKRRAAAAAASGAGSGIADGDEWDDTPDEVWRIPLTSTADPAAYKLSPELSVAAGALVSQLQKNGKIEGRGRTNRSSCPVYSG